MNTAPIPKPLRLWPGVALLILAGFLRFVLPYVVPDSLLYSVLGGFACGIAILLWWLLFSRAPWLDRLLVVATIPLGIFLTLRFADKSIATGAQGLLIYILVIPGLSLALVAGAVLTRNFSDGARRATMAAMLLAACGAWTLAKTGGFTAATFKNDLYWRWAMTPEDRLVAQAANLPPVTSASAPAPVATPAAATQPVAAPNAGPGAASPTSSKTAVAAAPGVTVPSADASATKASAPAESGPDWPGFRGPRGDGAVPGVRIKTDWAASPPVAVWRRPVGPGWSSFAVRGGLIYTQEQRGPDEVVASYKLTTGDPVWIHRDPARFWESNAGAGPRGTPTLHEGRVYTFGATGILNALNASDGSLIWSRNAATDAAMQTPQWGFASSPLVVGDTVIVAASGRLAAYDRATGAPRWMGPSHGTSYSSPRLLNVSGTPQVMLLSAAGATGVALSDGAPLWEHAWKGYPIVQPAVTANGDVLMSISDSSGIRRMTIEHESSGWKTEERWTSVGLKPYFNDFVQNNGYAFGFDGSILSCIDLKDGARKWKGGRYGNGQLVLLPDQDLLLILSEEGELALVRATPDQFTEVARFPAAIEGKTWNHPVLAGDILLVRNGQEMAAFRLAMENR